MRSSPRALAPLVVAALLALVIGATVVGSQVLETPSVPGDSPGEPANALAIAAIPSPTPTPRVIAIPDSTAPAGPLPTPTPAPTQAAAILPTTSPAQEPAATATQPPATQLLIADVPSVQAPTAIPSPTAARPPLPPATEPPAPEPTTTPLPVVAQPTPTPVDSIRLDFTADRWAGGFYRGDGRAYGRPWTAVYGAYSAYPRAALPFALDSAPAGPATLLVTGLDDEWPALNEVVLEVNGQPLYSGAAPFANWDGLGDGTDAAWTTVQFSIPADLLVTGPNEIAFANLTQSGNFNMPPYILLSDAMLQLGSRDAPQPVSPAADTQSDRDRQNNTAKQEKKQKDKDQQKAKKNRAQKGHGKPGKKK